MANLVDSENKQIQVLHLSRSEAVKLICDLTKQLGNGSGDAPGIDIVKFGQTLHKTLFTIEAESKNNSRSEEVEINSEQELFDQKLADNIFNSMSFHDKEMLAISGLTFFKKDLWSDNVCRWLEHRARSWYCYYKTKKV